jgi:putative colanic acid biosynthesis acetyltransferase WcaF
MSLLDAKEARSLEGGPSFSLAHRIERAIWGIVWLILARWTPPPFHRWRVLLLNIFGAKVHSSTRIYGGTRIWYPRNLITHRNVTIGPRANIYSMALIEIGEYSVISQGAYLCSGSHDICSPDFQLITGPIRIGSRVWIAADAFVGPNVSIGDGAVIGARTVLFRNAEPLAVYIGNPAVRIKFRKVRDS